MALRSDKCQTLTICCAGIALSSQAVSSQVFSTLMSLTSVFGMGTGVTSSPLTPARHNLVFSEVLFGISRSAENPYRIFKIEQSNLNTMFSLHT